MKYLAPAYVLAVLLFVACSTSQNPAGPPAVAPEGLFGLWSYESVAWVVAAGDTVEAQQETTLRLRPDQSYVVRRHILECAPETEHLRPGVVLHESEGLWVSEGERIGRLVLLQEGGRGLRRSGEIDSLGGRTIPLSFAYFGHRLELQGAVYDRVD